MQPILSMEDKKFETIMETLSFFQLMGEWGIEISDESELSDSDDTRNKKWLKLLFNGICFFV